MISDLEYFLTQFLKSPSKGNERRLRSMLDAVIEKRKQI